MTPPTRDQAEGWIAELSVITARRQDDEQTEALRLAAYASRLADYPADIVRHALLGKRWKFFPAWADLADACDELLVQRRRMMTALNEEAARMREEGIRARALPSEETVVRSPEEEVAHRQQVVDSLRGQIEALNGAARADCDRTSALADVVNDAVRSYLRPQRAGGEA